MRTNVYCVLPILWTLSFIYFHLYHWSYGLIFSDALDVFLILIDVCVPLHYLTCEKNGALERQDNNNNNNNCTTAMASIIRHLDDQTSSQELFTSILHLKTAFTARIDRMVIGHMELRVILIVMFMGIRRRRRERRGRHNKWCCCRDCWACSARWHVNQYDLIETIVILHFHETQSNLLYWPRHLGTVWR